ncbi:MAG: hypothetical protein HYV65_03365 [Candidatus Spechtbacteria bacterium]|nr:hypothetical protein [Candidatus Spechtbacteria bacterium]
MQISLQAYPLQLARAEARNADSFPRRIRVGAVITKGNSVLSIACNRMGTSTISVPGRRKSVWYRHAEVHAIKQADLSVMKGATVWVWREFKNGTPALAKPCEDCMELLKIVGIKRVVYTISKTPFFAEERI